MYESLECHYILFFSSPLTPFLSATYREIVSLQKAISEKSVGGLQFLCSSHSLKKNAQIMLPEMVSMERELHQWEATLEDGD